MYNCTLYYHMKIIIIFHVKSVIIFTLCRILKLKTIAYPMNVMTIKDGLSRPRFAFVQLQKPLFKSTKLFMLPFQGAVAINQ